MSVDPPPATSLPFRIGHGYDVHRFAAGRRLVLGGVEIAHERGLDGHSDADVVLHALMDALLGAAGLPDIGHLFPNTDPAWRGADSRALLRAVVTRLLEAGWRVGNVDLTIVAEAPKIAPHIPAMRERIAADLAIAPDAVGLKATTNEKMGFVGRREGIAAMAVALIARR
jgi:2-C-methyl-D-erythritol 2,4-cyclodiphosphate synthase